MQYRGIVKVFREGNLEVKVDSLGQARMKERDKVVDGKPNGMLLEVVVTAPTQESLVKKVNSMLATLDDDE